MHKNVKGLALILTAALAMTGCGTAKNLAATSYKASDYVELGEYTGLEVEQIQEITELTDEEKEEALNEVLSDSAEEQDVEGRTAQEGDTLSINYTCYQDGEVIDETDGDPVDMELGSYTYFDEEGEAQLLGTSVGDTRTIEIAEEDDEDSSYSYTYEVTVERIYTTIIPELTDELAQEQGYDSREAMETAVYQNYMDELNEEYESYAKQDLLQQVMTNSTMDGYPQELYDETQTQIDAAYQEVFGVGIDELFEGDEETVTSIIENELESTLLVYAIAEKENMTVTEKELEEYKNQIVVDYEYGDVSELEAEYDDSTLARSLLTEKVQNFLLENASVTYVTEEDYYAYYDDEDYEEDYEEYSDDEELDGEYLDEDYVDEDTSAGEI